MKTLVLEQGNSTLFAGVFRDDKLMRSARITKNVSAEIDRLARGKVDRIALCSVVPKQTPLLASLIKKLFGSAPLVLTSKSDHGLQVAYEQPAKLGDDRLANSIGAQKLYPNKNVIVVDCGSATTLTLLHRDGALLGGSILPGVAMWSEILNQRTARLPAVSLSSPDKVVGRDTDPAIRSGIIHGHAGAIRELISKSRVEAFGRRPVVVIGTGGQVTHFKEQSLFTHIENELILYGLQAFASRKASHA